jgi:hypothetical protein
VEYVAKIEVGAINLLSRSFWGEDRELDGLLPRIIDNGIKYILLCDTT